MHFCCWPMMFLGRKPLFTLKVLSSTRGTPLAVPEAVRDPSEETDMKLFECESCGQMLYFENVRCERCNQPIGYFANKAAMITLQAAGGELWSSATLSGCTFRYCKNQSLESCQWLLESDSDEVFCHACRLNRTIPDLSEQRNAALWRQIEVAKRRLVYGLLRFGLPVRNKNDSDQGLAFDFLADDSSGKKVLTGHANGVVTVNIAEADSAERERRKQDLQEPYRTLLGHLRHEVAHYYWEQLVRDSDWLTQFRDLFGDESEDYNGALQRHYEQGAAADWQTTFVSAYASSHPWEDWAETWAHYMHIVDTLETAYAFGIRIEPQVPTDLPTKASATFDPYTESSFDRLVNTWLPLTFAMNSLNRSMGHPDLYPFVLQPRVLEKLDFVHSVIKSPAG